MVWPLVKSLLKIEDRLDQVPDSDDPEAMVPGTKAYNDDTRATLIAFDDDGTAPREIMHWANAMDGAAPVVEAQKVFLSAQGRIGDETSGGHLRYYQTRELASESFDAMTNQFRNALAALNWDYEGYEATILTKEGN